MIASKTSKASEMALQVKLLATKSDNLSLIQSTHSRRKSTLTSCLLISRCTEWHTHKINTILKKKNLFKSSCHGRRKFSKILRLPWRLTFRQQQMPAVVFLNGQVPHPFQGTPVKLACRSMRRKQLRLKPTQWHLSHLTLGHMVGSRSAHSHFHLSQGRLETGHCSKTGIL